MPIFLYGTLLDPRLFARFAGRAPLRRAMPARLPGFRRVRLRGTPYPTLMRGKGEVQGLLLPRLPPEALSRLAAYEGASYALLPVRVATPRGPRRARAWVAPRWRAECLASWAPHARM
ncbi:gamma-glutamylcyclotransferase family protein [Falsiroseomonas sp.]|uniref:gamma-glutamylcyclotransferase family protein n=1 Tax=Falsiroseomonas sp. TaxID=2870721 RepID=UPI00356B59CF